MGFEEVPDGGAGVVLEELGSAAFKAGGWVGKGGGTEPFGGTVTLLDAGMLLGGGFTGELEAGIEFEGVEREAGIEFEGVELEAGIEFEGVELEAGIEFEGVELEAGIELVLWLETCAGFTAPGTQPGATAPVAGPGPSVTATQPGRYGMGPRTFSATGLGAVHEFITSFETKRFSFANTGQSWITPEPSVHVCTARESTLLSHPSMKSPCSA
jgi:hypothetical protein